MQIANATSTNPSQDSSSRPLPLPKPKGLRRAEVQPLRSLLLRWGYFRRLQRLDAELAALEIDLKRLTDAGLKYHARDKLKRNQSLYEERACLVVRLKRLDRPIERQA